jgi:hypothetical protein
MNKSFVFPLLVLAAMACFANFDARRVEKVRFPEGSLVCGSFVQDLSCPKGWDLDYESNPISFCTGQTYQGCGGGNCGLVVRRETIANVNGAFDLGETWCSAKTCPNNQQYFCGKRNIPAIPCAVID